MLFFLTVWFLFGALALGPAVFIYLYMKHKSSGSWPTIIDASYRPKVSIIIPTYNEREIISYKLSNSNSLSYPKNLLEIVIVDSNSSDDTVEIIKNFAQEEKSLKIKVLVENERKGKSHALNFALPHCTGEIIVISDADCFWPTNILETALPFLADPIVGAIGGPKTLFNSRQTWVTRMEENYLKSANFIRVGESKAGSTTFFEGGFSAFKREALEEFDPYDTDSDDCGSVIGIIEKNYRAMLVKEAKFYSSFPPSFKGKISIKLRRINQLIRVFAKYLDLLIKGKINGTKSTVIPNILLYLISPIAFVTFIFLSVYLFFSFPLLLVVFVFLLIPQVRFYFYEVLESNILIFVSLIAVSFGKRFSIWAKPDDRVW